MIMSIDIEPFENNLFTGIKLSWRDGAEYNECSVYRRIDSDRWIIDSDNIEKNLIKKVFSIWIDNCEVVK